MRDRITEIKQELETNKAVRSLESRYRQRHSNRRYHPSLCNNTFFQKLSVTFKVHFSPSAVYIVQLLMFTISV